MPWLGATTSDPVQVLFQTARAQAPIDVSRGITISIPAAHLSERSAEVLFYNDVVFFAAVWIGARIGREIAYGAMRFANAKAVDARSPAPREDGDAAAADPQE